YPIWALPHRREAASERHQRDGRENPLRSGFLRLDETASRGFALGRARWIKPPAGLGEPCRGDRKLGQVGQARVAQPDLSDHSASSEAAVFSGSRSAARLVELDKGCAQTGTALARR